MKGMDALVKLILCPCLLGILLLLGTKETKVFAGFGYDEITISIPVSCTRENGSETLTYEVVVEDEDGNEVKVIEIADNSKESFDITVSEPDTFVYKVYERAGDKEKVTYDDTIYYATVFVSGDDGKLSGAVTISIEDEKTKPEEISFVNIEESEERETKESKTNKETEEESEDDTEEKGSTVEGDSIEDGSEVATGDYVKIGLLTGICTASLLIIVFLVIIKNKDKKEEKKENI